MGLSSAFNGAAEHKERILADFNGRTTPIGYLHYKADELVFESQADAPIRLCASYAARTAAAHPDKKFQLQWQGVTHLILPGTHAYDIAQLAAGQSVSSYEGTFTTKFRMPPEALKSAITGDDFGALRTCLQNNAWPDAVFDDGATALTLAALKKDGKNYVKMLIDYKANVNLAAKEGVTPLMAAALGGDIETARLLLDAGADIDAVDTSGRAAEVHATNPRMKEFLAGPYPAEAAERFRLKKAEEEAAAAAAATVLQRNVIPMATLKLRKKPQGS